MARLILIILFFSAHASFGQLPDSIVIRYDKGHYSFGSLGQYSTGEIIKFTKTSNTIFSLQSHLLLRKSFDSANNKIIIDTTDVSTKKAVITTNKIDRLLYELKTSKNNFNQAYVMPFLKPPSKKEVLNFASKYELDWKWNDADKEDRKTVLRELMSFKHLDSFILKKKPHSEYDMVVIDVWNGFALTVFQGNSVVEYRGQFFGLFGQPVKRFDNKDYGKCKKVINLEINNVIKGILPVNSLLRKAIDLNAVKEDYIKWYLEQIM